MIDGKIVGEINGKRATQRHARREGKELRSIIVSDAIVDIRAVMVKFSDTPIAYFAVFRSNWTDEATCVTNATQRVASPSLLPILEMSD